MSAMPKRYRWLLLLSLAMNLGLASALMEAQAQFDAGQVGQNGAPPAVDDGDEDEEDT